MKRINKLTVNNFKFFVGEESLDFDARHILIYGENGSGKSSLYWALYTFLQSSLKVEEEIQKYFDKTDSQNLINRFIDDNEKENISISLELKDDNGILETFEISKNLINTNLETNTGIKRANATSDFINYKLLSRFYDFRNSKDIDIWELFEKEILEYITIEEKNLKDTWDSLKGGLVKIKNKYPVISSQTYKDFELKLKQFNDNINEFIANIIQNTNLILNGNFKENLSISLYYENATYNNFIEGSSTKRDHLVKKPQIILKAKFNDKDIDRPHTFLNEAKLTAIALSIRFSILKTRLIDENILKILVLDDLLISLDMSHRLEVINIILNDEDLKEYQKIILTHDRGFFEMAKDKFEHLQKNKWNFFEMYVDDSGDFEKPFINNESLSYLEKAEGYFKSHDYSVSGNYLRKASEEVIKSKLLETFKPKEKDGLDRTIQKYEEMCKEFKIPISKNLQCLKELTKRVFNPSSHDDIVSPLYKKEINDAINLVKKLQELPQIEILETSIKKGSLLRFNYDEKYEIVYIFLADVKLYTYKGDILNRDSILLSKSMHKLWVNGEWEETWKINDKFFSLEKIFTRIKFFINKSFKYTLDIDNFISNLTLDEEVLNDNIKKLFQRQCQDNNNE